MFHINIQCRLLVKHGVKTLHITAAVLIRPLGLDVKEVLGGRFTRAAAELTGVDPLKVVLGYDSENQRTKLINQWPEL